MADPILPYMRQLPQDYYRNNYIPPATVTPAETIPPPIIVTVPPVPPTDPINAGGIWIGHNYPSNPGEGWLFFDVDDNTLHIYVDGAWELIPTGGAGPGGGIADAPSDGKTYSRLNAAWTSIYDGGPY
jgi:hypothetical protein